MTSIYHYGLDHHTPPRPDQARMEFSADARKILYGAWRELLQDTVRVRIGSERTAAWQTVDLSANIFRVVASGLSALYDEPGEVEHDQPGAAQLMAEVLDRSEWWPYMQRVQRDTWALREIHVGVSWDPVSRVPVYDSIFPDRCLVEAQPTRPTQPLSVLDSVWSESVSGMPGKPRWLWRKRGPAESGYYEVSRDGQTTLGAPVVDAPEIADGFVPVVYRAQITGSYWDPYEMREIVAGTLELGVKYSFLSHMHLQASWAQRWALDCDVMGLQASVTDEAQRNGITTDPATVIMLRSRDDGRGQAQVGRWDMPVTVGDYHESIIRYEQRLASMAGLQTSDLLRQSGDPRSGYALAVSREAQIRHQRKYGPVYAAADARLLGLIAKVLNANAGTDLPVDGWRVKHRGVPLEASEIRQRVDVVLDLLDRGLVEAEWALARVLSLTEDQPEIRREAMDAIKSGAVKPAAAADAATPPANGAAPADAPAADAPNAPPTDGETVEVESVAASDVEPLNGAQVQSAMEILGQVARRELPRESGINAMIDFYGIPRERAEAIMGPVGVTFFIETQGDDNGRRTGDGAESAPGPSDRGAEPASGAAGDADD